MVKIQVNSQGKVYLTSGSKALVAPDVVTGGDDWGQSLQGDIVIDNTYICAPYKCFYNTKITSFSAPNAIEASMVYMLEGCINLTSISLDKLEKMTKCTRFLAYCPSLISVSFTALKDIATEQAMLGAFTGSTGITSISFPALTTTSFGSYTNQFQYMLQDTGSNVTHTIHFPSNLQSTISGLTGYPLFGGTSSYVVLSFDLPATS